MNKRKRSELELTGLPEGQELEGPATALLGKTSVDPVYPGGPPNTRDNSQKGSEAQQPAEVAVVETPGPPRICEGVANQETGLVTEVDLVNGTVLPREEGVDADWAEEEDADVAGRATAATSWFWELLEAAGYDVW